MMGKHSLTTVKGNNKKRQHKGKAIKTHAKHTVTERNFEELTEARARPLGLARWAAGPNMKHVDRWKPD
eukprot:12503189-Heterocapsa_arctica.AAC.1